MLEESEILESHRNCGKVQDPYCLRCVPQVHGASRDALAYAAGVIETEMNGVTDNPLVFENGDIVSGGNFHGQPLALALDFAAIALAELASISERRIYLLLEGHDGLAEAADARDRAQLGVHDPAVHGRGARQREQGAVPPGERRFDPDEPRPGGPRQHGEHLGAEAAARCYENVETVLAIEVLTAAQALDYRLPLRPGRGVEAAHQLVRARTPHREADYLFHDDLAPVMALVRGRELLEAAGMVTGEPRP